MLGLCGLLALAGCASGRARGTPSPTSPPQQVARSEPTSTPSSLPQPTATPTVTPTPTPAGPLVALDPGHGGEDLGARHFNLEGNMDFHESTINLQIALRIGEKLKAKGYRVFYARDGNYYPNRSQQDMNGDGEFGPHDDLLYRVQLINQAGADLLLSLHENAWEHRDESLVRATGGTTTYYCPDRPFGDQSLRFATLVHEKVLAMLRAWGHEPTDRKVLIDHAPAVPGDPGGHFVILGPVDEVIKQASQMPGCLSEPLFITCDAEAALMIRPDFQDTLAQAYTDAIVAYFEEQPKE